MLITCNGNGGSCGLVRWIVYMQDLNNTKYTMHIFGLSTSNKNVLQDVSQVDLTNVKQNVYFKMEIYLIV